MHRCSIRLLASTAVFSLSLGCGAAARFEAPTTVEADSGGAAEAPAPRLIVWFTIDQMRGDYLDKFAEHFGAKGFAWLREHGRLFSDAHYGHAITETAPGHATLFTGVSPREHGIIANSWLLPSGQEVSSVEDEGTTLVGGGAGLPGASPHRLLAPTIGDALQDQLGEEARVVSVSGKDRGAILPGGKRGHAFWLGPEGFVTSSYYVEAPPPWLVSYQSSHALDSYVSEGWPLSLPEAEYKNESVVSAYAPKEWGPTFPHQLTEGASLSSALANSPFGDTAVLDLALAALEGEELGQDEIVDLLAISLSSTDKIGHQFGPESRELEDQVARLDTALGGFLERLLQAVPQERVLIVMSADHGGCESVEFARAHGAVSFRITEREVEGAAREVLSQGGFPEEFLLGVASPYVYLNRKLVLEKKADLQRVRAHLKTALAQLKGVHLVHVLGEEPPAGPLGARLAQATHAERSGDLYIVPQENSLFLQSEALGATHGSPWDYDTHVPVLLVGTGILPGVDARPVDVRSLVPTVAGLIGIDPPKRARAPLLQLSESGR